jgi:hypothetical protein
MNAFFQHWTRSVVETLKQRHIVLWWMKRS